MTLKKIGTYKWVKNKNNAAPIKLDPVCEVNTIIKSTVKKEKHEMPQRKVHFTTGVYKKGATIYKNHPITYTAKPLRYSEEISASRFLFRDNATSNITYTDKAHGFIAGSATDVVEDKNHHMWIITDIGLVKYDGLRYFLYNKVSGIPSLSMISILYDDQQRLWINTEEGFYYIKNDSCFVPDSKTHDFSKFHGRNISADNKHNVWLTSSNMGAIRINSNQTFSVLDTTLGLPNNDVSDLAFLGDKTYLALLGEGLMIIEKDQWKQLKINDEHSISDPFRNAVISVLPIRDTLFIGTWAKGFMRLTAHDSILYSPSALFFERTFQIVKTDNGIAYSIYGNGIVLQSGNKTTHFNQKNGLIDRNSFGIFYDSFKNIWICDIAKGISRINENVFYKSQNSNELDKLVNIHYSPDKKHKWLFFNGEYLSEETDSTYIRYKTNSKSGSTDLNFMLDGYINEKNELWGASYANSGICKLSGDKAYFYFHTKIDQERIFYSVLPSSDQKLWFANDKAGLVYYDFSNEKFYQKKKSNGTLSNSCVQLKQMANKDLVCIYDYGMQKILGTDFYDFCINDSVYRFAIKEIINLPNGNSLLPTESSGLLLLKNNNVYALNTSNGLISNNIKTIFNDGTHIWLFTDKGIERIILKDDKASFDRFFDSNYGLFMSEIFGFCRKNSFGNLQTSGSDVYDYHPENELKHLPAPIIALSGLSVNEQIIAVSSTFNISSFDKLKLEYNFIDWGHENEYTHLVSLISQNADTFNYVIAEPGNIVLTDLLPGKYTLYVEAKKHHKSFYSQPIIFTVNPYWYNAWWFRLLMFMVCAALFLYLYKRKQLQNEILEKKVKQQTETLLKEKVELEIKSKIIETQNKEKDALIQEVHHRVKNNLQLISAMLKMQINSIKDEGNQAVLKETSRRINSMSLVHEMLYNKDKSEVVSTKEYLTELVSKLNEMVYDSKEAIKFDLSIEDLRFNINNCVAIGMITSEVISNSIKYAFSDTQAPTVTIKLSYHKDKNVIIYSISDNGKGLDTTNKRSGLGLRLIDIFSRQMEAEYETINDNGVKFIFTIPYNTHEK